MEPTGKAKRIIVNADDFGFSEGVTEGILRAHHDGIVTSTTVAANMPAAAEAVSRLAEAPNLGVGVHLNVTQGPPLSAAGRALAGADGLMNRTAGELGLAVMRRPRLLDAIEAECDQQIRWMLDRGIAPTHIDSHRHVHACWAVFLRVVRLARRYHIRRIRRHREVLAGAGWPDGPCGQVWTSRLLNVLGAGCKVLAPGFVPTAGTWGLAHTGLIDREFLIRAARSARPGAIEIMTHPGYAEDMDALVTRLRASRRAELEALCDERVGRAFAQEGIELVDYSAVK